MFNIALFGAIMAASSGLSYFSIEPGFNMILPKFVNLAEKGPVFPIYIKPPFALNSNYYIYEVKNRKEVLRGGQMKLNLKGPYLFKSKIFRDNILFRNGQTSVKYITHRKLIPDEKNSANFDERFWALNPIVVFVADRIQDIIIDRVPFKRIVEPLVFNSVDAFFSQFKLTLISYTSPRDYLMGEKFDFLVFFTYIANRFGIGSLIPPQVSDSVFGIAHAQNETIDNIEIYTGVGESMPRFAEVVAWREHTAMKIWRGDCNKLEGTNGELYKPFMKNDQPTKIFLGFLCRTFLLEPVPYDIVLENGLTAIELKVSPRTFQGYKTHPPNECYCKNLKSYDCKYDGLFSMGPCFFDAPLFFSKPPVKDITSKLQNFIPTDITGDEKLPRKQSLYIDQITGAPLEASLTFVGLFKMSRQRYMRDLANVQNLTYAPVIATTEGVQLKASDLWQIKLVQMFYHNHKYICLAGMVIGLASLLVGRSMPAKKKKVAAQEPPSPSEVIPKTTETS